MQQNDIILSSSLWSSIQVVFLSFSYKKAFTYFSLFIIVSCSYQPPKNEKLYNSLNDSSIVIRGKVIEISKKEYRFDYYDIYEKDSSFDKITQQGYQGGGPSWKGIVFGAILMSDNNLLSKIRFDEEAEGLAIWSNDKENLEKIGRFIALVKADEKLLNECISTASKNGEME